MFKHSLLATWLIPSLLFRSTEEEEEEQPAGDNTTGYAYIRPSAVPRSDYGDLNRATSPVPAYRVDSSSPAASPNSSYHHHHHHHQTSCSSPPHAAAVEFRLGEEGVYPLLHHSTVVAAGVSGGGSLPLADYQGSHHQHQHHNHHQHHTGNSTSGVTVSFVPDSPGQDDGYQPVGGGPNSLSPPPSLFRLTCSPVHIGLPPRLATDHNDDNNNNNASSAGPQFTALVGSSAASPTVVDQDGDPGGGESVSTTTTTATFRLSDLAESGYRLDLQSGQLQIHLDLSTGDVLNLSGVVSEAEPGSSPLLDSGGESTAAYLQPAYYDMSSSSSVAAATTMEDTEASAHSSYPTYFNSSSAAAVAAAGGSGGGVAGSALANNASSSSPYHLANRYGELYTPSLYSQYYQSGYSWAGAQSSAGIYCTLCTILCCTLYSTYCTVHDLKVPSTGPFT